MYIYIRIYVTYIYRYLSLSFSHQSTFLIVSKQKFQKSSEIEFRTLL